MSWLASTVDTSGAIRNLTSCDLSPSCCEQINRPLDIVDARREVRAALEELYLFLEVVHEVGGGE